MFSIFERWVNPFPAGARAAAEVSQLCVDLFARHAALHCRNDASHRQYLARLKRGCSVPGTGGGLAGENTAAGTVGATARPPLLLAGILPRACARRGAVPDQTTGARGNFADAVALDFHRNMLAQSLSFYQDEFAGRVATKVMQTALAVRDTWMILDRHHRLSHDLLRHHRTGGRRFRARAARAVLTLDARVPAILRFFVPRLANFGKSQADARSLMTGRITDAYTNITTVKLFSHSNRESAYARSAMSDFLKTVYRQMRMVTSFEVVNQVLSVLMIGSVGALTLLMWTRGHVGVGAVAAAIAMAMRLNGISHWMMWEMASLFEHVGTVQDGLNTLATHSQCRRSA